MNPLNIQPSVISAKNSALSAVKYTILKLINPDKAKLVGMPTEATPWVIDP